MTLSISVYPTGLEYCPPLPAPASLPGSCRLRSLSYHQKSVREGFCGGGGGEWNGAVLCSMWDLSSLTRAQTHTPCIGSAEA